MKNTKKTIIAIVVAVLLIAAFIACYAAFGPKTENGNKSITVLVIHGDGSEAEFYIATDSENLRGVLEQEELIDGDDSSGTMFVTVVDGEEADSSIEEWWCFTMDGEMLMTGVDDTMISDGDKYEITLVTGYDW